MQCLLDHKKTFSYRNKIKLDGKNNYSTSYKDGLEERCPFCGSIFPKDKYLCPNLECNCMRHITNLSLDEKNKLEKEINRKSNIRKRYNLGV